MCCHNEHHVERNQHDQCDKSKYNIQGNFLSYRMDFGNYC